MLNINVNFDKYVGKIKPMHAVNNGPVRSGAEQKRGNFEKYRDARIPYARTHDASFFAGYGGEHTVDVHAIFPDFNANPYDPDSYDFELTDDYLQSIIDAGTEVFYRLGSKIEHTRKKYGTIVPADFHKWSVICEHIIRHYNEGWANGFHHNIKYWEIWNEPDGIALDGDKPNWSGTPEQFYELYVTAATHLKKCFPELKIGGPAITSAREDKWVIDFFEALTADGKRVPLDFFSWHGYSTDPYRLERASKIIREILDRYGYNDTEGIYNEYNYVENWTDKYISSILNIIGMRGAAYQSAVMAVGQKNSVDMCMYYDARPSALNGIFDFYTYQPLKGYYPIVMFSELYKLEDEYYSDMTQSVFCVAAAREDKKCIMLTHYDMDKEASNKKVMVSIDGNNLDGIWFCKFLDDDRTMKTEQIEISDGKVEIDMPNNCVVLLSNYQMS